MPVLPLFIVTVFVSASLLFLVQPMFARMVLPLLGGSPAVWNTCMVFFQAALLGGYLYAHLATKWLAPSRQVMLHVIILLLPWISLPIGARVIGAGWEPPMEANPLLWLLMILAVGVGLPFFVVAASAPLLQKWFSRTGHATSGDPYFLYAASNAGSIVALLSYPLLVEPAMSLSQQGWMWTIGYAALMVLIILCAMTVARRATRITTEGHGGPRRTANGEEQGQQTAEKDQETAEQSQQTAAVQSSPYPLRGSPWPSVVNQDSLSAGRLLRWIALAFVPSSLMLGVTMHITTDLVVAPLLWVIPLAIYLLTFILVFARRRWIPHALMVRAMPIIVVVLLLMLLSHATEPLGFIVTAHLAGLFIIGMVCHGELANDRPHADHLTTFYLMLGVGGVLGGVFNAIASPLVFNSIVEYPAAIVFACVLMPPIVSRRADATARWKEYASALVFALILFIIVIGAIRLANQYELEAGPFRLAFVVGIPAVLCYLLSRRSMQFGLAVAAVFLAGSFETIHHGAVLTSERSFFGVHRVTRSAPIEHGPETLTAFNRLYHGTTLHGSQRIDVVTYDPINPREPLGYYHRLGPIGRVFASQEPTGGFERVGLVGLGVGAIAAYAERDQVFAFYEIDPLVRQIAEDERWFTYLRAARERGAHVPIVLGDARLTLAREPDGAFDLVILDAFTSDAIPVHLLTKEAVAMYSQKIAPGGLIAMHISSRYFDLDPLLAAIADELGLACLIFDDTAVDEDGSGRMGSKWAVLAKSDDALRTLRFGPEGGRWLPARRDPRVRAWTDDYSNILSVLIR